MAALIAPFLEALFADFTPFIYLSTARIFLVFLFLTFASASAFALSTVPCCPRASFGTLFAASVPACAACAALDLSQAMSVSASLGKTPVINISPKTIAPIAIIISLLASRCAAAACSFDVSLASQHSFSRLGKAVFSHIPSTG